MKKIISLGLFLYLVLGVGFHNETMAMSAGKYIFEGFVVDARTEEPLNGSVRVYTPSGIVIERRVVGGYFRIESEWYGRVEIEIIVNGYVIHWASAFLGKDTDIVFYMMRGSSKSQLIGIDRVKIDPLVLYYRRD